MTSDILSLPLITKTNLARRSLAVIVDYIVMVTFEIVYIIYFGHSNEQYERVVEGWLFVPIPLFWFLYFVCVEAICGSSLGHQLLNLKVLSVSRSKITFVQAFKRHLLDPVDIFMFGIPAYTFISSTDKHQRLGDMLARTIVVNTKDPEQYSVVDTTTM